MGVVYRVRDRERGTVVALKALNSSDPQPLLRLKNEFRALADVTHPNLVQLHELIPAGDRVIVTMELIEGVELMRHLRKAGVDGEVGPPDDYAMVRDAFRQLVEGVAAIHAVGRLHRDLKPSNVLVTREGRVVILDFGLALEVTDVLSRLSAQRAAAGTAEYMAPEQAAAVGLCEASDVYALGVMLFEALTGALPFHGHALRVMMDKQVRDAPAPGRIVRSTPTDLETLCLEMLRREPSARPSPQEVLSRLGADTARLHRAPRSTAAEVPFVARERELALLGEALERVRGGAAARVHVHGPSGAGKSLLVRRFADVAARSAGALVLAGRCYEREALPFRGFDAIVDALSRHLAAQSAIEVESVLPRDAAVLARIFPVLRRVDAIAQAPQPTREIPDRQELRRRAFRAFRELFGRMTDRTPVVLFIDDMQWADVDTVSLVHELLRAPDPPALMFVASFRAEDVAASDALEALHATNEEGAALFDVAVGPLAEREAQALAEGLLAGDETLGDPREVARTIARESRGHPFFLHELVRHVQSGGAADRVTLEDVVVTRVAQLPAPAQRLLEVVSIAGRVRENIALSAAAIDEQEARANLGVLRAANLVRGHPARGGEELEPYHDRIRETVLARLDERAKRAHHRRLATALEVAGDADPEALAVHFRGAGDVERARRHAVRAAERAAEALAFDSAASLYRMALSLEPDAELARTLQWHLGDALANAGRGAAAAAAYSAAAAGAKAADALDLRRRAAEQLLLSGRIDQGLAALDGVLGAVGMRLSPTPGRALFGILWGKLRLGVRGYSWVERDVTEVSAAELRKVDVCWSVVTGLGVVDNVRANEFVGMQLLLALRTGERFRIARALACQVAASAIDGRSAVARTARLARMTHEVATRSGHPFARGFEQLTAGLAAYLEGRFRDCLEVCESAGRVLRDECVGATWERGNANLFSLWALAQLGEFSELLRRLPALTAEARARGDLYALTNLRSGRVNFAWLVADDPERARREVEDARAEWPTERVHLQHYYFLLARVQLALYVDDRNPLPEIDAAWSALDDAFVFRIQSVRIEAWHLRARAALAAAEKHDGAPTLLRRAERDARAIESEGVPWASALAALVRAAILFRGGDSSGAIGLLTACVPHLEAAEMTAWAAVARVRLGELKRDDALREAGVAALLAAGVRSPDKFVRLHAPGFAHMRARNL